MITIRSSSLPRVMVCNGSLNYLGLPDTESDAAKEGTAFHEYVEQRFKGGPDITQASNGWTIDSDMVWYANKILPLIPKNAICEQELAVPILNGEIQVLGHLDYCWEEDDRNTLVVMDIKYGHRTVEVKDNWQLLSYAMGELIKRQRQYEKIKLMIVQPRPYHVDGTVRTHSYTYHEIMDKYYYMRTVILGERRLTTSDKCRYCPASGVSCPAINMAFYNGVDVVLNFKNSDNMTGEQISEMLKTYERVKDVFDIKMKAVLDHAQQRISAGEIVPGYGVQQQFGHRVWRSDLDPKAFKMMTGKDIMKTQMMLPAEVEKLGVDESLLDSFAEKPYKGLKVVPVDQKKLADKIFGGGK